MLSIIIPTYRRGDLLLRCLASVDRFKPVDCEVIVVDDASPTQLATLVQERYPDVRTLRLPKQGGFAQAVNRGIEAARGDIVQLLNDDAEVTAGWAEPALGAFTDPSIAAVAPLVLIGPEGAYVDSAGDRYYVGGIAGKRGHRRSLDQVDLQSRFVFGASASSAFYRRSALLEVGLFAECFGSYFEDVDLAFRLQRAGYQTLFEPRSRVLHRVSSSFGTVKRRLLEQQSRNEERVFWRNLPAADLWRALPKHVAVLVGKAIRRWNEGTLAPFAFGRLKLLGEIGHLWRHRRDLEARHPASDMQSWHVDHEWIPR